MAHSVMLVCFLLKRTSGHLNSNGFLRVFLMTRATKKKKIANTSLQLLPGYHEFENEFNEHKSHIRTICNGICQKSRQLQFAEIRKMVAVDPARNILT